MNEERSPLPERGMRTKKNKGKRPPKKYWSCQFIKQQALVVAKAINMESQVKYILLVRRQ